MDFISKIGNTLLLACKSCKHAILPVAIDKHFTGKPHHFTPDLRAKIAEEASRLPELAQSAIDVEKLPLSAELPYFFPNLELFLDGFHCLECLFTIRTIYGIQQHFRNQHNWVNPRQKGKPTKNQHFNNPWVSNVACQRFFHSPPANTYFKVNPTITFEQHQHQKAARSSLNRSSRAISTPSPLSS